MSRCALNGLKARSGGEEPPGAKPFNAHLQVDFPAYTAVVCQQYEMKAFADFEMKVLCSKSKVLKHEITVVMAIIIP